MPGVLKRPEDNHRDSECSRVSTGPKSGNMAGEDPKKAMEGNYGNGVAYINGHSETNGSYVNGLPAGSIGSQISMAPGIEERMGQLPPEIEHITFGYLPLSKLITRLVQETFNGLNEVINEMSDLQVSPSAQSSPPNNLDPHINGNGIAHNSQANVQKKLRLLNFAQDRRAQFIKILVLSQWSRQADAISKVIDLKVWLDGQKRIYDEASVWMGELKRILGPLKMPNPDLKTALEALSLGKASWLPDLGYIPPKLLSSQEILKALRNINTLLSIRLNLHEKIPPSFRDFSIESGRAIFRVPDEFEVELSIADEDPQSQLYFIDFRFTFSPAPTEISGGRIRDEIEGRTNDALKREGLSGCYEFLHDLVLTHKLSILRSQAYEMARGLWSQHLKVEAVHRSLVVQYWLNRPGGKSWVEVGIRRRRVQRLSQYSANQDSPHIALRWFRSGKEITNVQFNLELGKLSLQKILKKVIAMHTNSIFEQVATKLREGLVYSNKILKLRHVTSVSEPLDATIFVQLTTSKAVKMVQEPVTGRFALQPSSLLHSQKEKELNNLADPASEISARLASLRVIVSSEEVEARAQSDGWEGLKSLNPGQETMGRLFPRDTLSIRFFRRKDWSRSWVLAFTTSLMRDSWWIVELGERRAEVEIGGQTGNPTSRVGANFKVAYRIPMTGFKSLVMDPSYSTLAQVERSAAGMISQYIDTHQLNVRKIPCKLVLTSVNSPQPRSAVLNLRLTHNRGPTMLQPQTRMSLPWAHEIVTVTFQGIDPATNSAIHTVAARLQTPIPNISSLTSKIDYSIAFHPTSGEFAFRIFTPVGESTIPLLLQRLSNIEHLIQFFAIIKRHDLSCSAVSLTHLEFVYASNPSTLKATVYFFLDLPTRIFLDTANPHLRIQDSLTSLLRSPNGLHIVIKLLKATLPLLRAFSAMETAHASGRLNILSRSAVWYQVRYENAKGRIDLRLRQRRDSLMWFVKDLGVAEGGNTSEKVGQRMKNIKKGVGGNWQWMGDEVVASTVDVEDLMRRIDEVYETGKEDKDEAVRNAPTGKKRKAEDEVVVLE